MKPETLLRLYPRQWRERYGDEMLALLEQSGMTWRRTINVIGDALRARARSAITAVIGSPAFRTSLCPSCAATIDKDEWSKFWMRYSVLDGSVIRPCASCGSLLRMSAAKRLEGLLVLIALMAQMLSSMLQLSGAISRRADVVCRIVVFLLLIASVVIRHRVRLETVPADAGEGA